MFSTTLYLLKLIARIALLLLVVGYFAAASVMLFTRYWVLPRVDQWRPAIEQIVSESVGTPVKIGQIKAQWQSLNAALRLSDVKILGQDGVPGLTIPNADAIVSWRSLLHMAPVFQYIGVDSFDLTVSRQGSGEFRVAGLDLGTGEPSDANVTNRLLNWLSLQSRVNFTNATLTWIDPYADTPTISITEVDLTLNNRLLTHELSLSAKLPAELGDSILLAIRSERTRGPLAGLISQTVDTEIYVALAQLDAQRLSEWLNAPPIRGTFGGQAWLTLKDTKIDRMTIDLAAREASGGEIQGDTLAWQVSDLQTRVDGRASLLLAHTGLMPWLKPAPASARMTVAFEAQNLLIKNLAAGYEHLSIDDGQLSATINRPSEGALAVAIDSLSVGNRDGVVTLNGQWSRSNATSLGKMDVDGTIARLDLTTLPGYLASTQSAGTNLWMGQAFKKGFITKAGFKIRGPVDAFPYDDRSTGGIFRLDGVFQDLTLDYAPAESADELGWPPLVDVKGAVSMLNDRLSIKANAGALLLPSDQRIAINRLTADVVDLETVPILSLDAQTEGAANSYALAFKETALKNLVPTFIEDISGTGQWSMPLTLQMNLEDVDAATFRAELNLNGGSIAYADVPAVTVTGGRAVFSETGFVPKQLVGNWLGGDVAVSGAIDDTRHTLEVQGELAWSELAKYTGSEVVKDWFTGQMPYQLVMTAEPTKPIEIKVESLLRGTEIKLPAPFGKTRQASMPMTLGWKEGLGSAPDTMALRFGSVFDMQARFGAVNALASAPVIGAAAITIGDISAVKAGAKLENGLAVFARLGEIDSEQWRAAAETLYKEVSAPRRGRAVLAPLRRVDLSAASLQWEHTVFDALNLELGISLSGANSLVLKSEQTAGTVRWQTKAGQIDGRVVANFDKLHIGSRKTEELTEEEKTAARSSLPKENALSEVPALDLTVDEFAMFGSPLGRLQIVGENSPDQTAWKIDKLRISNPNGEVMAAGIWRFSPDPGISMAAHFDVKDLGKMSSALGLGDRLRRGDGSVSVKIDWRDFPWRTEYSLLDAQIAMDLKDGVFDGVDSRGARVLELLSLQSLNRLFSLNVSADSTFQDGFPWRTIRGDLSIDKGMIDTRNLRVNSAVATIAIVGGSNLVDETWKLDANVRPNLDMSGAAIATGFVVNPLVGLGALVGQYLLKIPVERALSVDYLVTGTWDLPLINGKSNAENNKGTAGEVKGAVVNGTSETKGSNDINSNNSINIEGNKAPTDPKVPRDPTQEIGQGASATPAKPASSYVYKNKREIDP